MTTIENIMNLVDALEEQNYLCAQGEKSDCDTARKALRTAVTELASTATEYQQAADKMAMEHKVELDGLTAEVERLKVAAKYAEHIDATPENQRETMLHDVITERDTLRQQLSEAQTLIEASRKQEPVATVEMHPDGRRRTIFKDSVTDCDASWKEKQKLYADPVVAPDVLKDARRYRWLRDSELEPEDQEFPAIVMLDDFGSCQIARGDMDATIDKYMAKYPGASE